MTRFCAVKPWRPVPGAPLGDALAVGARHADLASLGPAANLRRRVIFCVGKTRDMFSAPGTTAFSSAVFVRAAVTAGIGAMCGAVARQVPAP